MAALIKESDMDKAYAKEFRDWKIEVEDRLARLEAAQNAKDAVSADVASQAAPTKKTTADAASSEKDAV